MLKNVESIPEALIKAIKSVSQTDNLKLLSIIVEDKTINQSIQRGLEGYRIKKQSMLLIYVNFLKFQTLIGYKNVKTNYADSDQTASEEAV